MSHIIIDTREHWKHTAAKMFKARNISYEITKLDVGDYELYAGGRVLNIERKTISDFVTSIGVLGERIPKIVALEAMTMLLLEGYIRYDENSNILLQSGGEFFPSRITRKHMSNMIFSMQMKGIMYWHTTTYDSSLRFMCSILEYLEKSTFPMKHFKKREMTHKDKLMTSFMLISRIGEKNAKKLLDYSLQEIAIMNKSRLAEIIGSQQTASVVYNYMRRK